MKHEIKVDEIADTISIDEMVFSFELFKHLKDSANEGMLLRLENIHDNVCTLTRIDN